MTDNKPILQINQVTYADINNVNTRRDFVTFPTRINKNRKIIKYGKETPAQTCFSSVDISEITAFGLCNTPGI